MRLPFIFTALAVTTCSADVTWIGGESGSWNEASNWDGGKVPEKCVVVFTNSASVTWSSQSDGERMIRGFVVSGEVDLGNLDSQDGEGFSLDLACKFPKIASLEGISSISSSRLGKVYLLVTGDAPDSWNGTVTGNVSIQYGDEARLDGFRMLVK